MRYETVRSQGLVSVCLLMKARVLSLSVRSEILPGMIHSVQKNIKQKKNSEFEGVLRYSSVANHNSVKTTRSGVSHKASEWKS